MAWHEILATGIILAGTAFPVDNRAETFIIIVSENSEKL